MPVNTCCAPPARASRPRPRQTVSWGAPKDVYAVHNSRRHYAPQPELNAAHRMTDEPTAQTDPA
jgi:hypothetical protein